MRRREFITLLSGAAAWPLAARAQQRERMRRIAVISSVASTSESQARLAAFVQGLQQSGWTVGQNLKIEYRWGSGNADHIRKYVAELVTLAPDIILATGSQTAAPLLESTRTIPVVFVQVADPVGAGFVESLARPGGNATGFANFEYGISGKWVELLKEIAPHLTRVAVLRDPTVASGTGQLGAIQAVAPSFGVELTPVDLRTAEGIERAVTVFARKPNGGLIVTAGNLGVIHRELIFRLAVRHRLPAAFSDRAYVDHGGLISYGPDRIDQYRQAAGYVDRILRGEKPAELPVQEPTKYDLVINLKTAKTLGLEVPPTLLARADEVIE
jgi:putative ABC transport system substrate-binding protein